MGKIVKNVKRVELNKRIASVALNTQTLKMINTIQMFMSQLHECLCCNRNYKKKIDENLKKRSATTYKFSNHNINKFILLL